MSTDVLKTMQSERAEILANLIKVRADIKKYEAMLKPRVAKPAKTGTLTPPPEEDPYHEEDSDSL
jgi:hypothetical protein